MVGLFSNSAMYCLLNLRKLSVALNSRVEYSWVVVVNAALLDLLLLPLARERYIAEVGVSATGWN